VRRSTGKEVSDDDLVEMKKGTSMARETGRRNMDRIVFSLAM